ncbi:MAG: PKD domain-containing protein, partial [Planctomycetales bacterium]|nr:PKD domain-containing protein [Planctomycetales bacterium]
GVATLNLSFGDPGTLDAHTVEVDWGDGGPAETFTLSAGARLFSTTHQYLDDNPTGTSVDDYSVQVKVIDDDTGEATGSATATVRNVAPSELVLAPPAAIDENGVATLNLSFVDPGTLDMHTVQIDWGDGTPLETVVLATGARTLAATHQYLDDNPTGTPADSYAISVTVTDDDGGSASASTHVQVANVPPQNLVLAPVAAIDENGVATLQLSFDDPGTLDSHTVEILWNDGSPVETFTLPVGQRTLAATHQYLDDDPTGTPADTHSIGVTVRDDDGGAIANKTTVEVRNVAPTLPSFGSFTVSSGNEGDIFTAMVEFVDVGTLDTHMVTVDWGDGYATTGAATGNTFTATHTYADNAIYLARLTVVDDDGGQLQTGRFVVVQNVAPTLAVVADQTVAEGSLLSLTDIGTFTDPGFDNPLNVIDPISAGEVEETFTYSINWGDGTAVDTGMATVDGPGSPGVLTAGSFDGAHTYADDGVYTVTVSVFDDDGGEDSKTFQVTVGNVAPTLAVVADQTIAEGSLLSLADIGAFTDPGFDNPLNTADPANGGEVAETFDFEINWGDGTAPDFGFATIDAPGMPGSLTAGSFDGQHTYADNGLYTVEVRVLDDDGGIDIKTFRVTVTNVDPTLTVIADQTIAEGSLLSLTDIGTFTDPGFDNPANTVDPANGGEVAETFDFEINWGDGTAPDFGFATVDAAGSPGVLTAGSFNGQHTFADNGLYTVEVRVLDDDGGLAIKTFQVLVTNVDPVLTGVDGLAVDEGSAFTLAGLGVGVSDPGFDNPLNTTDPANGGETVETFTGATVDWGDGTAIDSLSVVGRVSGSPGVLTTAGFDHAPHTYADNGVYTVTLRLSDDDGAVVARTLQITVSNVAPTLTLTDELFTLNEGETLTIPDLAKFTDPGFDNLANTNDPANGAETTELFTYTIDWGDGTPVESFGSGDMVRTSGSPGVLTTGSFGGSHLYADNDADNKYMVTVTLADDDGGVDERTIEVTVLNVNPTLDPVAATDVTASGVTTLDLTFADPGTDSFEVLVDWGDKLSLPPQDRFVVETVHAGPTPKSFTLTHKYNGPPDPLNPAADITITVKIHDDDFGTPLIVQNGESNLELAVITNPGEGKQFIYIDTTPQVPRLEFTPRVETGEFIGANTGVVQVGTGFGQRGGAGEAKIGAERFFELRVIYPDGRQSDGYRLPNDAISNIPSLFRDLPDNHYAIYLVQPQTGSRRLVIEVFVRNGKLIDPGDDSEGARDRPPTDDAQKPAEELPVPPVDQSVDAAPAHPPALATSSRTPLPLAVRAANPAGEALAEPAPNETTNHQVPVLGAAGLAISATGRAVLRRQQQQREGGERRRRLQNAARAGANGRRRPR